MDERRSPGRLTLAPAVFVALALAGCGRGAGGGEAADRPSAQDAAEVNRLLSALPPAYRQADLDNGRLHFALCRSCHTVIQGGPDMTGPNLYGVFGRQVASRPGYTYSSALKARTWTWDAPHLDGWLEDPSAYAPGTKMGFYGLHDDKDRLDTIAYLKVASAGGPM